MAKLNWVLSLTRIGVPLFTGGAIPGALQLLNEIKAGVDSNRVEQRLRKLEDPISSIHRDIPLVAEVLYYALEKNRNSTILQLRDSVFDKYRSPLAMLEAESFIEYDSAAGSSYSLIIMSNPYFILYAAALGNKNNEMNNLVEIIEHSSNGRWFDAKVLSQQVGLPIQVINAFSEIYVLKGLGEVSRMDTALKYFVFA